MRNILFTYCSKEWHPIITGNQVIYTIPKGERIFSEGDKVKGIYFINDGYIKVSSAYNKTHERILRLSGKGELLGHRGFAASRYPVSATALTNATLTFMPNTVFRTLIKSNPALSIYLVDFLADELREAEEGMKSLMYSDIKNRIARILIRLIDLVGYDKLDPQKLAFNLSRKDFANMAGTTYETVVRTLAYFHKKKYIRIDGKAIRIINVKKIRSI